MQLIEMNLKGNKLILRSKIIHKKPIELVNAFMLRLDDSEFVDFKVIDLSEINVVEEEFDFEIYEVNIQSIINSEFEEINQKYLDKLGSLGLSIGLRI